MTEKTITLKWLEAFCRKFSFEQQGHIEKYDTKKMQENIKVSDILIAAKKQSEVGKKKEMRK